MASWRNVKVERVIKSFQEHEGHVFRTVMEFCISDAVYDLITLANFGEDRLRVFVVARGRTVGFSTDLRNRHCNILALPVVAHR